MLSLTGLTSRAAGESPAQGYQMKELLTRIRLELWTMSLTGYTEKYTPARSPAQFTVDELRLMERVLERADDPRLA